MRSWFGQRLIVEQEERVTLDVQSILAQTEHRPYPLPSRPWVMKQAWHDLLFAHWPISPSLLRPLIPAVLPLDTYAGEAWVGIVPFYMTDVSPRAVPAVPWLSTFPELNVRTYVTVQDKPGVYFFSLDAGNPIAVFLARTLFALPYYNASMQVQLKGDTIHYHSHRTHRGAPQADFEARYRPVEPVSLAQPGSLEAWFTERYCLYTVVKGTHVYRGDIHHSRWPLQVAELEQSRDTMAFSHSIHLPDTAPLLHFSALLEVLIWPLQRVPL